MDLLTALHNFATALVNRNSDADIKKATHDLHLAINPGAAAKTPAPLRPVTTGAPSVVRPPQAAAPVKLVNKAK